LAQIAKLTHLEGDCRAAEPPCEDGEEGAGTAAPPSAEAAAAPADNEPAPEPEPAPMPPLPRLGLAKAFARGPPLEHRSCIKLKWGALRPPELTTEQASLKMISQPPLSLRDGSVLVICDEEDHAEAKARAQRARRAGGGAAAGTGKARGKPARRRRPSPSVQFMGAGAPSSSSSAGGGRRPAERSLKIHTGACEDGGDDAPQL
jgi:hypothetical protein